jgi:hypothetical protein
MSIPLDRLYHYIESIAQDIRDDVIIYRFYPHGSKKIEDLHPTLDQEKSSLYGMETSAQVMCHDQEPLSFDAYTHCLPIMGKMTHEVILREYKNIGFESFNLRSAPSAWSNIYDKAVLLHSEQRSNEVSKYQNHQFIPVYYWSHALIARDWFRYAQYQSRRQTINKKTTFLIYNRAWSGTREYRLKFMDYLLDNNLVDLCRTSCNPVDPETMTHYTDHQYQQSLFRPAHNLEKYFKKNIHSSTASADFDLNDYSDCDIEVVLETLFDDLRLHLTEKTLRPIACNKPFLLCATHGSLKYLQNYGFKTFGDVIDESYDLIENPLDRLKAVIKTMNDIASWTMAERTEKLIQLQNIANYNQQHFFSQDFYNLIIQELKTNLNHGLEILESTNTSKQYIDFRKLRAKNSLIKPLITKGVFENTVYKPQQTIIDSLKKARQYYNRYRNK